MSDLRDILTAEILAALRGGYRRSAITAAMVTTIETRYPPLGAWNREIERLFYVDDSPLAAIDRERCLLALLVQSGPPLSLAVHVYWGLMEGLSVDEVCHIMTLAACYGGVPRLAEAFPVLERVGAVLGTCAAARTVEPGDVLRSIMDAFGR